MKRVLSVFCAISLVVALTIPFASCTKTVEEVPDPTAELKFNIQVVNASDPGTKAVKTEWAVGDKIFVFFRKKSGTYAGSNVYVVITYNGTTWDASSTESGVPITWENGFTGPGTMYAIYFPFGKVQHSSSGGFHCSGYANEALNGIPPFSYYMIDTGSPYTLSGSAPYTVNGTLTMKLPDNFVWFYIDAIDGKYNVDGKYRLSVQGVQPATVTNWSSGSFSQEILVEGQPMWGFKYGDGIAFAGMIDDSWATAADHQFILFSDGDPAVYKTINGQLTSHKSVKLAAPTNSNDNGWAQYMAAPTYVEVAGVKWAEWNLGSASATDKTSKVKFRWAEIVPDRGEGNYYDQSRWHSLIGDYSIFDPARAILGKNWRMPNRDDFNSLVANATLSVTDDFFTFTAGGQSVSFVTHNALYNAGGSNYLWTSINKDVDYCYVREYHVGENKFPESSSGEEAKRAIGVHFIRPIYTDNSIGGDVNKEGYTPTPLGE